MENAFFISTLGGRYPVRGGPGRLQRHLGRAGDAAPDCQQPDHVQRAAARQRGRPGRHTQHHPAFRQLSGM